MYSVLLVLHSFCRWLLFLALLMAIYKGFRGWLGNKPFGRGDNRLRHTTATIAHIQLVLGYILYFNSPFIRYFRQHYKEAIMQFDYVFFGMIHIALMTIAVVLVTAGSSIAKRKGTPRGQFRAMACWFLAAFLLILMAIPWPFSPLSQRPYFRML